MKALAAHNPACIYLCARTISTAEQVVATVHQKHPKANVQILPLDLNSFESIRSCFASFDEKSDRLDLLFLNAGVSGTTPSLTQEGYESQFGINFVGHALFLQLLMPKLLHTQHASPFSDVRIMFTSSIGGHHVAPETGLVLDQMKTNGASIAPLTRYGHSKLAQMLFARKLAQLYPDITSTSHHPGTVKTDIWGKATDAKFIVTLFAPLVWLTGLSADKGAETGLWCAVADRKMMENGRYYEPVGQPRDRTAYQSDQTLTEELWEWTDRELKSHGSPGWPAAAVPVAVQA